MFSGHDRDSGRKPCYAPPVATILLAGVDLFFRGKLEALLPGHHFVTTDAVDEPELVIADISRIDPNEVADAYPEIPIVGFTNHTDTAGLRAAHAAGFDQVVAKSALVERAPVLVEELLASSVE
jgi:DNA-binding NarL/FixJ family response regulator